MSAKDVPTVAKRNDPAALEPYAKSQSTKAENLPAGFVGQWFRPDQLDEKCRPHEIGDPQVGYLMVAGWQVVHKDEGVVTGRGPAAGSNNTDTTVTKGDLVLCKLPVEEHAKYAVIDRKRDALVTKRLAGERHNLGGGTKLATQLGAYGDEVDSRNILGAA